LSKTRIRPNNKETEAVSNDLTGPRLHPENPGPRI